MHIFNHGGQDTATAKSLQSCLTARPHRRQPTRLPHPWDSLGKNTGVGCHFLLQCMKVKSERDAQLCPTLSNPMDRITVPQRCPHSVVGDLVSKSCLTLTTSWTVAHQAPLSMDFPGKNTGVGCHFLLQGILPTHKSNPGLVH